MKADIAIALALIICVAALWGWSLVQLAAVWMQSLGPQSLGVVLCIPAGAFLLILRAIFPPRIRK